MEPNSRGSASFYTIGAIDEALGAVAAAFFRSGLLIFHHGANRYRSGTKRRRKKKPCYIITLEQCMPSKGVTESLWTLPGNTLELLLINETISKGKTCLRFPEQPVQTSRLPDTILARQQPLQMSSFHHPTASKVVFFFYSLFGSETFVARRQKLSAARPFNSQP